jgi:TATA-box binding protein (TBP) (component of TFIID and TFIIIB)
MDDDARREQCLFSHLGCPRVLATEECWRSHVSRCRFMPRPAVANIVTTCKTDGRVNIDRFWRRTRNIGAVRATVKFPCVMIRTQSDLSSPKLELSTFAANKILCPGSKSLEGSLLALRRLVDMISEVEGSISIVRTKVTNVVGSLALGCRLDLEEVNRRFPNAVYIDEIFPGLLMRDMQNRASITVFASGKINIAGLRFTEQILLQARLVVAGMYGCRRRGPPIRGAAVKRNKTRP